MPGAIRVLHYLNQVYAGIGREEKADLPIEVRDRPIGPARLLNFLLGEQGEVVATIICGDNYFGRRRDEALAYIEGQLKLMRPQVVVAGPAFDLALYGRACGDVCLAAQGAGIAAVTAMTPDNPASVTLGDRLKTLQTGPAPGDMMATISLLRLEVLKLVADEETAR